MAITVAELVAEPQLGLTLLAGTEARDNRITWAHTSDLPRLWEWVTGGELMMTNGLSIPADAAGQVALAEALVDSGASAWPSARRCTRRHSRRNSLKPATHCRCP
jgi:purine catabolism regulator